MWATYNETDQIALREDSGEWYGPLIRTVSSGTLNSVLDDFNIVGTGTAFAESDIGCYLFLPDQIALITGFTDSLNIQVDRNMTIEAGSEYYILGEDEGEKVNTKLKYLNQSYKILSDLSGYIFPDVASECMKDAHALLSFELYTGAYSVPEGNTRTKREKIGDYEKENFQPAEAGGLSSEDELSLSPRIKNCLSEYKSFYFGGDLCQEPDNGR